MITQQGDVRKICSMARSRAESLYFKNLLAILGSNYILGVKIPDLGRKNSKNVIFGGGFEPKNFHFRFELPYEF